MSAMSEQQTLNTSKVHIKYKSVCALKWIFSYVLIWYKKPSSDSFEETETFSQAREDAIFLGPRRPLNDIECEEWFLGELNTPSRFPFRELSSGELIGFCGIKIIDGENDFGYFLRRKSWGKGFGKLMCKITLEKLSE